ncbi:hypothetical protein RhiirA5_440722 [Rhizophagus irregularis]|uniref:Uncharacterized protein n=1 Tax=Rhizophagus irregularis TaxID=588596 RepID=A0A2N0NGE8_9GLOM|nr:hypothetical protein RhiirA5_440722 [Rhizophagus irregularis]
MIISLFVAANCYKFECFSEVNFRSIFNFEDEKILRDCISVLCRLTFKVFSGFYYDVLVDVFALERNPVIKGDTEEESI